MKIPKGWKRLRKGSLIERGDKYYGLVTKIWRFTTLWVKDEKVGWDEGDKPMYVYIRRIKKRSGK